MTLQIPNPFLPPLHFPGCPCAVEAKASMSRESSRVKASRHAAGPTEQPTRRNASVYECLWLLSLLSVCFACLRLSGHVLLKSAPSELFLRMSRLKRNEAQCPVPGKHHLTLRQLCDPCHMFEMTGSFCGCERSVANKQISDAIVCSTLAL